MTQSAFRPILSEGEFSFMLQDGLSNAELDRLLQSVDRRGTLYLSPERVDEMIASFKATGRFGFQAGIEERGFDAQQALESLYHARGDTRREAIAAQVRALDEKSRGRYEELERNVKLDAMLQKGEGGVEGLPPETVKAIACQYVQEVSFVPRSDVCEPAAPPVRGQIVPTASGRRL